MSKEFFAKVKNREYIRGTHIFAGMPPLTECIAGVGFDAIWIDTEHTPIGIESLQNNLIAARAGGTPAVVRIAWNDPVLAKPVLDMGVDGIIFPYVRTAEEAKAAVESCDYPPYGIRGFGPFRALEYGKIDAVDYIHNKYRETVRIIQIEHIDAVNNLEEMCAVEGIDAFVVGMNDLSGSMGHLGDTQNPEMLKIYDKIAGIFIKNKKSFGVSSASDPKILKSWADRGANIIFSGGDIEYVYSGAVNMLKTLTEIKKQTT